MRIDERNRRPFVSSFSHTPLQRKTAFLQRIPVVLQSMPRLLGSFSRLFRALPCESRFTMPRIDTVPSTPPEFRFLSIGEGPESSIARKTTKNCCQQSQATGRVHLRRKHRGCKAHRTSWSGSVQQKSIPPAPPPFAPARTRASLQRSGRDRLLFVSVFIHWFAFVFVSTCHTRRNQL